MKTTLPWRRACGALALGCLATGLAAGLAACSRGGGGGGVGGTASDASPAVV